MLVVHGTRKFLDRVRGPNATDADVTTSQLGNWYATVLYWKRQVALLVNETTLVPLFVPLAPSATLLQRLPGAMATLLDAHRVPSPLIKDEVAHVHQCVLACTRNRSVVGVMTEFAHLAEVRRTSGRPEDLLGLSVELARTPTSPLYQTYTSPDRALAAFVEGDSAASLARPDSFGQREQVRADSSDGSSPGLGRSPATGAMGAVCDMVW